MRNVSALLKAINEKKADRKTAFETYRNDTPVRVDNKCMAMTMTQIFSQYYRSLATSPSREDGVTNRQLMTHVMTVWEDTVDKNNFMLGPIRVAVREQLDKIINQGSGLTHFDKIKQSMFVNLSSVLEESELTDMINNEIAESAIVTSDELEESPPVEVVASETSMALIDGYYTLAKEAIMKVVNDTADTKVHFFKGM